MPISDDLRQAIRDGRIGPSAVIVLHPTDYAELVRGLDAPAGTRPTFQGMNVMESASMTPGHAYIVDQLHPIVAPETPGQPTPVMFRAHGYHMRREPIGPAQVFSRPMLPAEPEPPEKPAAPKATPEDSLSLWDFLDIN